MELTDARTLALGGALITETSWHEGALLNPACAAGSVRAANASYARHMVDMWSGRVSVAHPVMAKYTVGGYLTTFNFGDIDVTEINTGATGESFQAYENIFVAYGAGFYGDNLSWGGAFKYFWGSIDAYSASGVAIDLGITYDPGWYDLKIGAVLRNLGTEFSGYGDEKDPLPTQLALGVTRRLLHLPLTVSSVILLDRQYEGTWDADFLPGNPGFSFGLGGQFEFPTKLDEKPLKLLVGYRSRGVDLRVGQQNDLLAGTSFGLEIPYRVYRFEYAFCTMGALGGIHRIGISGTL